MYSILNENEKHFKHKVLVNIKLKKNISQRKHYDFDGENDRFLGGIKY